jgi:Copper type II ascorbate-dependent monooxygenase, C-terminal domain
VKPKFALVLMAGAAAAQTPTFTKDVAPILDKNCVICHRSGDIAPMALTSYDEARPWAKSIKAQIATGKMPPWHATEARGTFSNDRRLTDQEKETLIAWVDHGAPKGDPTDQPPLPAFAAGWEIGKPDVVLSMEKPYAVVDSGTIKYQYFQIPTNFTEDKWIKAIEVRPGVRSVVHHILVFCKEPEGKFAGPPFTPVVPKIPAFGTNDGAKSPGVLIATTAPGTNGMRFPEGTALRVKAGSTLTLQIHYTANGKPTEDTSTVGLIFAKEAPRQEMRTSAFMNPIFTLPAGDPDKEVDSAIEFNQDSHIYAIFPHTHVRGKDWSYQVVFPDGRKEQILSVPHYDFNWQTYYTFAKPLAMPKGSRLEAIAHYDNSANNPSNPDPKVDVHWGEQTWQEMQYTGLTFTVDEKSANLGSGGRQ